MGLILNGQSEHVPGLTCTSWTDDPSLRLQISAHPDGIRDGAPRPADAWVRQIVLHSSGGIPGGHDQRPQVILPGIGPGTGAGARSVHFWSTPGKQAGAHLIVDRDGSVSCTADLLTETTYHVGGAPGVNDRSVGIEIVQSHADASIYDGQLDAALALVDWLTRRLRIQRQIPDGYRGHPWARLAAGARDFVGVFGHRDADANRGDGDPGTAMMERLRGAGYEAWDLDADVDLLVWKERQRALQRPVLDGIPGARTALALEAAGHLGGLWIPRPGDDITDVEIVC